MFLVGLTGGIASGKSSVAQVFQDLGCAVIDVDVIARLGEWGPWGSVSSSPTSSSVPHLSVSPFKASAEGKAFQLWAVCGLSSCPSVYSPLSLTSPHDCDHPGVPCALLYVSPACPPLVLILLQLNNSPHQYPHHFASSHLRAASAGWRLWRVT